MNMNDETVEGPGGGGDEPATSKAFDLEKQKGIFSLAVRQELSCVFGNTHVTAQREGTMTNKGETSSTRSCCIRRQEQQKTILSFSMQLCQKFI
jgi:hypothetical protein